MARRQSVEVIKLEHVCVNYELASPILYDINYSFYSGGFYFLTGPGGSGKTSFLKLIYRDIKPSQGRIKVFGRDLATLNTDDLAEFLQRMGLVFQTCQLFDHLDCIDNVALPLKISGMEEKKARIYAQELLDWVGLSDQMNQLPTSLSHSQNQRVAVARAVITKPLILLADEPTCYTEGQEAHHIIGLFEELNKTGTTVIVATHNLNLMRQYKYPVLCIEDGALHASYPYAYDHSYDEIRA